MLLCRVLGLLLAAIATSVASRVQTLVLIKPDGVSRGLVGRILSHFEDAGLRLDALKVVQPTRSQLAEHYKEHVKKSWYPGLEKFMMEGPIVAVALSNQARDASVIARVRRMMGSTDSRKADPGTVRALYGTNEQRNIMHASESEADAVREILLWIGQDESIENDKDEL